MMDADALSALLGERSDRQLRLLMAAVLVGPSLASPHARMQGESAEDAARRIVKGGFELADAMIELDKQQRP